MKFVVDAMLGKVAVWLRLTGNDTLYSATLDDNEALVISAEEGRTLLTADEVLHQRATERKLPSMLVRGSVDEKVASVFHTYSIPTKVDPSKARCSKCNGVLEEIDDTEKGKIEEYVHKGTYDHYDRFWFCEDCKSVFFQGGYWENIKNYMKQIQKRIERNLSK